jgi:hypothetical protein
MLLPISLIYGLNGLAAGIFGGICVCCPAWALSFYFGSGQPITPLTRYLSIVLGTCELQVGLLYLYLAQGWSLLPIVCFNQAMLTLLFCLPLWSRIYQFRQDQAIVFIAIDLLKTIIAGINLYGEKSG